MSNPHLNPRQRAFAAAMAAGLTQTEAARRAGYSEDAAHVQASRLMQDPAVREELARLVAARRAAQAKVRLGLVEGLRSLRLAAEADGKYAVALTALKMEAQLLGLYPLSGPMAELDLETLEAVAALPPPQPPARPAAETPPPAPAPSPRARELAAGTSLATPDPFRGLVLPPAAKPDGHAASPR